MFYFPLIYQEMSAPVKWHVLTKELLSNIQVGDNFKRGKIEVIAKEFEPSDMLTQEIILVPCNPVRSDHWYL